MARARVDFHSRLGNRVWISNSDIEAIFTDENAVSQENAPGAARTRNLRLRRPSFYPVELRARMNHEHNAI
jgi:hypothetical protein